MLQEEPVSGSRGWSFRRQGDWITYFLKLLAGFLFSDQGRKGFDFTEDGRHVFNWVKVRVGVFLLIFIEQVNSAGKTLFWFPRCNQGQGVFDVANKYWQYLRWSEKMYFAHFLWRWRLVWLLKCWVYIMFWLLFSRLRSDVCFKGKN